MSNKTYKNKNNKTAIKGFKMRNWLAVVVVVVVSRRRSSRRRSSMSSSSRIRKTLKNSYR